jgi:hypothetical protein
MSEMEFSRRRTILAALLGALGGGLIVALGTQAISKIMTKMMQNMISQMGEAGCDPAEM